MLTSSIMPFLDRKKGKAQYSIYYFILLTIIIFSLLLILPSDLYANIPRLPGQDQSDQLTSLGVVLRIVDSILFAWISRIIAGLLILQFAISIRGHNWGVAFLCLIGAIIVGLTPMIVKNIFDMSQGTLFSVVQSLGAIYV